MINDILSVKKTQFPQMISKSFNSSVYISDSLSYDHDDQFYWLNIDM